MTGPGGPAESGPAESGPEGHDVGARVRLRSTGEVGVVVACWVDDAVGALDCYVAFFGDAFPAPGAPPAEKPYILRYLASSLEPIA